MSLTRTFGMLVGFVCLVAARRAAAAPDRRACLAASEEGQTLKIHGSLIAARAKLSVCADPACPRLVRTDCVRWIEQIDKLAPTIVIGVQDSATGSDLQNVRISLDGAPFATSIDGRVVVIDPGPHTLRFEAEHYVPHEERIVALEGEQGRILNIRLVHVPTAGLTPPPPPIPALVEAPRPVVPAEPAAVPAKRRRVEWSLGLDATVWVLSLYPSSGLNSLQYIDGTAPGLQIVGRMAYVVSPTAEIHVDATVGAFFLGSDVVIAGVDSGDSQNFVPFLGRAEVQLNATPFYSLRLGGDIGGAVFLDGANRDNEVMFAVGAHASVLTFHFGYERRITLSADETGLALLGRLGVRYAFEQTVGVGYTF